MVFIITCLQLIDVCVFKNKHKNNKALFPGVKKNNTTVCLFCFYSFKTTVFFVFLVFCSVFFVVFDIKSCCILLLLCFFLFLGLCGY
ncbi:hypothetical protein BZL33_25470 [Escherichia coli]|nr:hypothetical protein BZL33_25470 [Escherichia coli]